METFGFACGRCWDRDCKCTPQELEEYNKQSRINRAKTTEVKVSLTFPEVSPGDIIIKDSKEYYIKDIIDGIPIGNLITNNSLELDFNVKIEEPYQKIDIAEANELFKQQIIDARQDGHDCTYAEYGETPKCYLEGSNEQYYKETFKQQEL
jgi:hypothetical protein